MCSCACSLKKINSRQVEGVDIIINPGKSISVILHELAGQLSDAAFRRYLSLAIFMLKMRERERAALSQGSQGR